MTIESVVSNVMIGATAFAVCAFLIGSLIIATDSDSRPKVKVLIWAARVFWFIIICYFLGVLYSGTY